MPFIKMQSLKYLFVKNICFSFYCEEMRVFLTNLFVSGHVCGFAPVDKSFSNPEGSERY